MNKFNIFGVVILGCLLLVGGIFAGAKRIDDTNGDISISITGTAPDTANSDKFLLTKPSHDLKYDVLMAQIFMPDMEMSDTGGGNTDTIIVQWKVDWGYYTTTLETDTGLPPCTLTFNYYQNLPSAGEISIYGDSTAAVVTDTNRYPALYYDHFWFTYIVHDTALAADSTGTATLQYWIRMIEE